MFLNKTIFSLFLLTCSSYVMASYDKEADNNVTDGVCKASTSHPLNPKDRPESLVQDISETAKKLRTYTTAEWRINGSSDYGFMNISAREMIVSLVQAYPNQKEFYIADIGAGNFAFNESMSHFFNENPDIPDDVRFHFVGLTGENYYGPTITENGKCTVYNFDQFAIENMEDTFAGLDHNFKGKFDLILSSYTLMHLHDPVGTLVQAYDLLKPGQGMAMFDDFPVYFKEGGFDPINGGNICNLAELFLQTEIPFLMTNHGSSRGKMGNFLVRRKNDDPLSFPVRYGGTTLSKLSGTTEKNVALFEKDNSPTFNTFILNAPARTFFGDYSLFEWVYDIHLPLQTQNYAWQPLDVTHEEGAAQEIKKTMPPLFEAAQQKKSDTLKVLIENGADVNTKDVFGTPLVFKTSYPKVKTFLINQDGFDPNATDKKGQTLLHQRINKDVMTALLAKKPDVNSQDHAGNTPLHNFKSNYGFREKFQEIYNLLIAAGADPEIKNNKGKTPNLWPLDDSDHREEHDE